MQLHPHACSRPIEGLGRPELTAPFPRPASFAGASVYSAVQQQDYSSGVWLRRRDKLEHSQQKCIVVFALVCCFAVLVALIFSAVDVWGDYEDGITEENCSRDCRIVLVENIPEDLTFSDNGTTSLPFVVGLHSLLDRASRSVEIVSSDWALNSSDESSPPADKQGQLLLQRLLRLKSRHVDLKVASGLVDSADLRALSESNAEVHYLNMTALTKGQFHSSFWVVDRKHMYIGSGGMDWRSLSKMKELGVIIYDCSCLVLDLDRIFSLYWQLEYKDYIPSIWSKRVTGLYNKDNALSLLLNDSSARAFVSSSPDLFCPKDRTRDIDAIYRVILDAKRFIYISITDYLPLVKRSSHSRYWSLIDEMLREALILRGIKVRLLISCWRHTNPLTFNFVWSLKTLCMQLPNCTLEVKFFSPREFRNGTVQGINHNKYMVTDSAVYIGNFDWVGNEFAYNAGAGLVISQTEDPEGRAVTIVGQLKAAFERDWYSRYTKSLQANKVPECSKSRVSLPPPLKTRPESRESKETSNASL
ncbi:inactive phospholipase D5-like isoform X3 [Anguilla anguilla]|uniref:inactive phospholipase D5-like isoform X3 n=1 Tax=Anguilla anguilla TaxID=7936 RepID=UPI0015ABA828|nr:inactive phospholipase D5-like isoform X3 [Anguilla anguilla]